MTDRRFTGTWDERGLILNKTRVPVTSYYSGLFVVFQVLELFFPRDVTNMKKLSLGRIQAFVVEERSGLTAMEQAGAKNVEYNKDKVLSEMDVFYAFQKTPNGEQLAKKFSQALEEMRKDGTFQKIMSKAK